MTINVPKRIKTTRLKRGSSVWKNPTDIKKDKKAQELSKPRITIIIPTKNQYANVANSFNSVWTQVSDYDHVIIADRGSTDGTSPGMFTEDERITYIRYPNTTNMEIINFAIMNVVQTKYVMLLDTRSQVQKGYLNTIRKSIGDGFVSGINKGMDGLRHRTIDPTHSFTGYTFRKNDALKVGLFSIKMEDISPALFVDKMKEIGKTLAVNEYAEIITRYNKLENNFNKAHFESNLSHYTDYNNLNFGFSPVSFIWVNKQFTYLRDLIDQLKEPDDDVQILNTVSSKLFNEAIDKAKNDTIFIMRNTSDRMMTYDPLTNLRLLYDGSSILKTGLENFVSCYAFSKKQFKKTKDSNIDKIVRSIAKNTKKSIEQTKIIEHKSKIKIEDTMRSGVMVSETAKSTVNTVRKKKGQTVVWEKRGQTDKLKRKPLKKGKGGVTRVGIKNYAMKWSSVENLPKIPGIENRKPKILFISDVAGWAWHYKSKKLKEYLSDDFHIDIIWLLGPGQSRIKPRAYDLYVTFGYSYIDYLANVAPRKKMTGITAHRPHSVLVPQMRKAAVVHANSMMLYKELKTMHNIVYYVPNGVDEKLFKPMKEIPLKREHNDIIVGHVGKHSMMKGQDKYIKPAIKRASGIAKLHLNDYTNAIPIEKMPQVYQDMDCFIVASKEDGTPNPALEAAACGRPIISNRIGNMPEFIKDGWNGFLVEKEVGAYVEKIRWFKRNRAKMIEMGQNARKTVEKSWTWKIQAENYRQMFKEVLGI